MLGLVVVLFGWTAVGMAQAGLVPAEVAHKAQTEGAARVIVQLDVVIQPEGNLDSTRAVLAQRQAIATTQSQVLAELAGTSHRLVRQFETIPFLALEVALDALAALERSAWVGGGGRGPDRGALVSPEHSIGRSGPGLGRRYGGDRLGCGSPGYWRR